MVRVAGHIHGSGEISPAPGSETTTTLEDAAIKLPEGAVASARPVRPAQGSMGWMGGWF